MKLNNEKLAKGNISYFSLPADPKICGRICKGCYAHKGRMMFATVQKHYWNNYKLSLQDNFVDNMIGTIKKQKEKKNIKYFRWHDSGEFYSKEYINKVYKICKALPDITFYAYTKRIKDFANMKKLSNLDNFILIDSAKFGELNYFDSMEEIKQLVKKYKCYVCPKTIGKDVSCNNGCTICLRKQAQNKGVIFKRH